MILYGLNVWDRITNADTTEASVIEVYGKQFGWSARYPGEDQKLGSHDYKLVGGCFNALGIDIDDINSLDDKVTREPYLVVGKLSVLMAAFSRYYSFYLFFTFSCTDELCSWYDNTICIHSNEDYTRNENVRRR